MPVLLTFGETVYVKDVRITVERRKVRRKNQEEWILNILNAKKSDEGSYECQIATEPPQSHKINLFVEGKTRGKKKF